MKTVGLMLILIPIKKLYNHSEETLSSRIDFHEDLKCYIIQTVYILDIGSIIESQLKFCLNST